mgnify:FL=1
MRRSRDTLGQHRLSTLVLIAMSGWVIQTVEADCGPNQLLTTLGQCMDCSVQCKGCITNPSNCQSCANGYYRGSSGTCLPCALNCRLCFALDDCVECKSGYRLSNDNCVESDSDSGSVLAILFSILSGLCCCFACGCLVYCCCKRKTPHTFPTNRPTLVHPDIYYPRGNGYVPGTTALDPAIVPGVFLQRTVQEANYYQTNFTTPRGNSQNPQGPAPPHFVGPYGYASVPLTELVSSSFPQPHFSPPPIQVITASRPRQTLNTTK